MPIIENQTRGSLQLENRVDILFQEQDQMNGEQNNIPSNIIILQSKISKQSTINTPSNQETKEYANNDNTNVNENQKKSKSWRSWIAASNTMMGTSIVVFPVVFKNNGIITSLLTMVSVGILMWKTCSYYVKYSELHEKDTYETIQRLLGYRWKQIYNLINALLLFLVQIIYFLLLTSFLFPTLKLLLNNAFDVHVANRNESTYEIFSFQWTAIITCVVLFILLMKRDLTFIMKVTQFGLFSVAIVIIFAMIKFGENVQSGISFDDTPLFTSNVIDIAGIFILSFQVHCVILPLLRNNIHQNKIQNDLKIIYAIVIIVYIIVSIFGVLAIAGKSPLDGYKGDTFLEYFSENDGLNIAVRIGLCIYIIGVYPIIVYASRINLFSFFYPQQSPQKNQQSNLEQQGQEYEQKQSEPSYRVYIGTNILYCGCSLIAVLIELNLSLVMSVAGYAVSFFAVILIPILIRIKGERLIKNKQKQQQQQQQITEKDNHNNNQIIKNIKIDQISSENLDQKCVNNIERQNSNIKTTTHNICSSNIIDNHL